MDQEGTVRRLDRPDDGQSRRTTRCIGILGKPNLTKDEQAECFRLGQLLATLGSTLAYIETPGTSTEVRKGVEASGGETQPLVRGVIAHADHTLVYPDTRLLTRLLTAYPDLESDDKVTIIEEGQLAHWNTALTKLCEEQGLTPPPR